MARHQGGADVSHFYFTIGSADSFERSLDNAQAELGIPSRERIPVMYANEVGLLNIALNLAPSLLLLGVLFYSFSKSAGGRGGAGGPGGIFNVGKSKGIF